MKRTKNWTSITAQNLGVGLLHKREGVALLQENDYDGRVYMMMTITHSLPLM